MKEHAEERVHRCNIDLHWHAARVISVTSELPDVSKHVGQI